MQNSSIVQFSTAVGWLTKKIQGSNIKKACFRAENPQEALEVQELHREKFVFFLKAIYGDFSVLKVIKNCEGKNREASN